jgi:hypothetical protein
MAATPAIFFIAVLIVAPLPGQLRMPILIRGPLLRCAQRCFALSSDRQPSTRSRGGCRMRPSLKRRCFVSPEWHSPAQWGEGLLTGIGAREARTC